MARSWPRSIVPDNAKVAVIKACLYEPQANRTYAETAANYGTAVLPTRRHGRVTKPRSKWADDRRALDHGRLRDLKVR